MADFFESLHRGDFEPEGELGTDMRSARTRDRKKASTPVIRVNVGGERYQDHEGNDWEADQAYHAGSWGTLDMPTTDILTTTDRITATEDGPLFQSIRVGEQLRYRFDVPNGTYQVRLLFAEIYWESSDAERQDVHIQDERVLANFSMFDEVGHDTAIERAFTTKVTTGKLAIDFVGLSLPMHSGARVCALEVRGVSAKQK